MTVVAVTSLMFKGNVNLRYTLIDTYMMVLLHFYGEPMTLICHWFIF